MKSKIIIALKNKYANLGFSDKAIETVADFLSTTVSDEANIETAVGGVENLLRTFNSDADRRSAAIKMELDKLKNPEGGSQPPTPTKDPVTGNPEIDKLLQVVKGLTEQVTGLVEKNKTTSLQSRWEAVAKEKGVTNPKLIEKWMPKSEDDFDGAVDDLVSFNTDFLKTAANDQTTGKPASPTTGGDAKKAGEMLQAWANAKKAQTPAVTTA